MLPAPPGRLRSSPWGQDRGSLASPRAAPLGLLAPSLGSRLEPKRAAGGAECCPPPGLRHQVSEAEPAGYCPMTLGEAGTRKQHSHALIIAVLWQIQCLAEPRPSQLPVAVQTSPAHSTALAPRKSPQRWDSTGMWPGSSCPPGCVPQGQHCCKKLRPRAWGAVALLSPAGWGKSLGLPQVSRQQGPPSAPATSDCHLC